MSCEMRSMITRYPLGSAIFTPPAFRNSAFTPSTFMPLMRSTTAGGKAFSIPKMIPIFFTARLLIDEMSLASPTIKAFVLRSLTRAILRSRARNVIPCKKCHPERLGSFACERSPESKDPYLVNPFASRRSLMCDILIAEQLHRHSAEVFYCHPQPPRPLMVGVVSPHIQPVRNPLLVHDAPELSILVQTDVPLPCGEHDFHLPVAAEKPLITHIRQVVRRAIKVTMVVIIPVKKLVDVESPAHAHAMRNHVGMLE